ncbi:MAG: DUF92 domain-containing protein [Acidobacteriia bacterium]|nr:DUF92 domain-containing protein [Terriglobia bacterium]
MGSIATELRRKSVHMSMGLFALLLRWLSPFEAAACAAVALLFNLFVLHRLTRRSLLRDDERARGYSTGIVLYPAAVLTLILVFHHRFELAAACWALMAFGDGMATVTGVSLRGPKLPWNERKTWWGFCAFALYGTCTSALLIRWVQHGDVESGAIGSSFLGQPTSSPVSDTAFLLLGCLAASVVAGFAESLETGVDDNLLVPLTGGGALYAATLVEPVRLAAAGGALGHDLAVGAAVNVLLAAAAYAARGVDVSGAAGGWVLGTLLYGFGGWRGFLMLLGFFAVATAATQVGYARKAALGIAQERGGRRGARHALANAGAGVLFAFLAAATPYHAAFTLASVAAFATALADTASSEVGQAFGRRHFLVTTFRRVPAGTEGAVSVEGTLAGVLASIALASAAWGVGLVGASGVAVVTAAAFVGTTLESYLGAIPRRAGPIDNEFLNFANTLAGGLAAIGIFFFVGVLG